MTSLEMNEILDLLHKNILRILEEPRKIMERMFRTSYEFIMKIWAFRILVGDVQCHFFFNGATALSAGPSDHKV